MNKLRKEYNISGGHYYKLRIAPNYGNDISGYKTDGDDAIFMEKNNDDEFISFSLDDAREIVKALSEIIETVENYREPRLGDCVTILEGQFKGMTGIIRDVDVNATERELTVKINRTKYHDEFYAYIDEANVMRNK